ncbi:hypothetical protein [Bradyrhizobium sp. 2TAF24]|uniref:hypothetical protein n=1 Tax=Bradyrhizobium sp. 2TAF24 TaxID=3233011 RepID=UPI003F9355E6
MFRMAMMAVLLAGPAAAQSLGTSIIPETPSKTPDQIERERALERDYKESLKKIPDGRASSDPWSTVRSVDSAKPAAVKPLAEPKAPKASKAPKAPKTTQAKPAASPQ